MIKKLLNNPDLKDKLLKSIIVIIMIIVLLLSFDVLTESKDGRRQIIDDDGGTETELCSILSDIDGVGAVDVMLHYSDDGVSGVIVTAQGAGNPVVKNNVICAVKALFNIPATSVEVFEKSVSNNYEEE